METMTVPALTENLPEVNDFILSAARALQCPAAMQMQIELALEELFVNVCSYAYAADGLSAPCDVSVSWEYGGTPPAFTIEIADRGIAFDPLATVEPDVEQPIDERPIGGLGIFLVKSYADELTYRRDDGENILRFSKRW